MSALFAPNVDWLGTADGRAACGWTRYERANGKSPRIPRGNNETYLQHPNLLGSTTQDTDHLGNWTEDILWYPWGQLWQTAGSPWEYQWATWQAGDGDFKGAWFRTYDDLAGRWTSPDPLAGDITNPQSLNWYAYVLNNPTSNVDPLGLDGCDPEFDTDCDSGDVQCSITDAQCDPGACDPDVACGAIPSGGEGGAIPPVVGSGGFPPPGLGGIGICGGGMGSGPLSGDYGPGLPPLSGGGGLPCEFGECATWPRPFGNGYSNPAGPTITPGGVGPGGQPVDFTISLTVQAYPGGLGPLRAAGQRAGPMVKVLAVGSAIAPAVTVAPVVGGTVYSVAAINPGTMAWLAQNGVLAARYFGVAWNWWKNELGW